VLKRSVLPDLGAPPAARPLRGWTAGQLQAGFEQALAGADGRLGAHCVHEVWMRGDFALNVERALERLWKRAADSIPEWLPMRHIEWLPLCYQVAQTMRAAARGRSNFWTMPTAGRSRMACTWA
jgi:hypothetical protein